MSMLLVMIFASPVFSGMNKTSDKWNSDAGFVKSKITDQTALKKIKIWQGKMDDGYGNMDKSDYYELAGELFDKLIALSKQNNGPKIYKPEWLD